MTTKQQKELEKVKKVINQFPEHCQKNFYQNLKTLKIEPREKLVDEAGAYNSETNTISLVTDSAMCHELFHMAFNNQKKYHQELKKGLLCDNGVSIKGKDGIYGHAIVEGMAEYLNRKCNGIKGKPTFYYFVDLLISIYGEDILEYALDNKPLHFFADKRFKSIGDYVYTLDILEQLNVDIRFVAYSVRKIKKYPECDEIDKLREDFYEMVLNIKTTLSPVILGLFSLIIDEYNHCDNPNIDYESFVKKIEEFTIKEEYNSIFKICDNKNIKENILSLISDIKTKNKSEI